MTLLTPGANAPLPPGDLTVTLRHGTIPGADIDISAFLISPSGKVRSDDDMCFYGQPSVAAGAVALLDAANGESRFAVAPQRLPSGVDKVLFTATIHENRATFGQLTEIDLDLGGVQGRIACAGMTETALILAEIYLRNGAWKVRVVGQGFNGGLAVLATHLGVDIAEPAPAPAPAPAPPPPPAPQPPTVNLSKVSLSKQNRTISLAKEDGRFGTIRVNLNWQQKAKKSGLFSFGAKGLDLDLGAFIETRDGERHVVQALGKLFGDLEGTPYVKLLGDDCTGASADGEWLEINGDKWSEIRRVLIYAFIYRGAPNWQETDGVIRVMVPGQPEIEVRMNEYGDNRGLCAVASLQNEAGQVQVSRLVTFHDDQRAMDGQYGWGFEWRQGRK